MNSSSLRQAIVALRGGRPVQVGAIAVLAVETATDETLALLDAQSGARLLISGSRAAALSLANDRNAADPAMPVAIQRSEWLDAASAQALSDPGQDYERAPMGPLQTSELTHLEDARAALDLARHAGLLPSLWMLPGDVPTSVRLDPAMLNPQDGQVELIARAKLPLAEMPDTQIVVFRATGDGQEHVALVVGAFGGKPPLVRLHSECLTGDVFGSLKCDCGPQLHEALRLIAAEGGGILLYLRQEGRGIGLANKVRAYALQDRGLDTVEANRRLGFRDDERGYDQAAAMLSTLGAGRVRLLTNNPAKVQGLQAAGIDVVDRVAHHMPVNAHNADYLETKRRKSGHLA